ncbi:MAG TPA: PilZ domain-containing protein [Deltaproteobacteria bacterium]|nr:PilZ domain-containing protein [Deltaproteobacteria bacterium]HPP81570.1 PilZ domain-containing protein [Deltaproteobacteria bacterium]
MNIDSLLNLDAGITAMNAQGERARVRVGEILEDDIFVLVPEGEFHAEEGGIVKVTDGQDSVLAKVVERSGDEIRLCMECYLSPGHERRSDVRIYDRVYYDVKFICHASEKAGRLHEALDRIRAHKTVLDSFVRGRYGESEPSGQPARRGALLEQHLWEMDRKLDLIINMVISEDFKALVRTIPREVNISASGMRFISAEPYDIGDILELHIILPMRPLLMVNLIGEVLRLKPLASTPDVNRWAVAVRFHRVDDDTREDIIRYLFRRQREVLRQRQP